MQAGAGEGGLRQSDLYGPQCVLGAQSADREQVEVRLYMERVEIWYGQRKVEEMPRLSGRSRHRVDYRHIIDWLVRKPGALENYRYRDEWFRTSRFRMAFDELKEQLGARGSKEYLAILEMAVKESEAKVDEALRGLLDKGERWVRAEAVRERLRAERKESIRDVQVASVTCGCLMNSVGVERYCNEWGDRPGENGAGGKSEGAASADDAKLL